MAAYSMLLQYLYVPFSINGAFTDAVQVTHAMDTNTPHTSQMLAFELYPDSNLDSASPLWSEGHDMHNFQKQFEMWTLQTKAHFPLCISLSQISSGSRGGFRVNIIF
ncbi:hypothetical protein ILYODFUR_010674 [Ilyodon furcidens]|uniref:Uncharacterized protein n=1 Tax=Ilyodon furcidens TaxID=33524 RepID=A0ABV0SVV9_9TELE